MAKLIINTDKAMNSKQFQGLADKLAKIIYSPPPMFFKDEGGYYVTKFFEGKPIEYMKMYEFGTLTEQTVTTQKEARKLADSLGYKAVFG